MVEDISTMYNLSKNEKGIIVKQILHSNYSIKPKRK